MDVEGGKPKKDAQLERLTDIQQPAHLVQAAVKADPDANRVETGIFDQNEIYSYITEGIGDDILPKNVDFDIIDGFEKVTDKDGAVYTRKLAREEGIFVGNSAGSAIKGVLQLKDHFKPEDVVVVLFHDHGSRYVGKMFNDDWMRERGFLDEEIAVASDLIKSKDGSDLVSVKTEELVSHAIERMRKYEISQLPVMDASGIVGSLDESSLFRLYFEDKFIADKPIKEVMGKPYPIVKNDVSVEKISALIHKNNQAGWASPSEIFIAGPPDINLDRDLERSDFMPNLSVNPFTLEQSQITYLAGGVGSGRFYLDVVNSKGKSYTLHTDMPNQTFEFYLYDYSNDESIPVFQWLWQLDPLKTPGQIDLEKQRRANEIVWDYDIGDGFAEAPGAHLLSHPQVSIRP